MAKEKIHNGDSSKNLNKELESNTNPNLGSPQNKRDNPNLPVYENPPKTPPKKNENVR
jgi:hypothetical protein